MKSIFQYIVLAGLCLFANTVLAQNVVSGKIFDAATKEPLAGATVRVPHTNVGTTTNGNGSFILQTEANELIIKFIGFQEKTIKVMPNQSLSIGLDASANELEQVVITANREAALRTDAPVAISKLSAKIIDEAKPTSVYEVLNKVSGVNMVSLNNEQHQMSIRQPMTTNAYFLYMEDGLPLHSMGVFNHNALIEVNQFAISSLEVIKGPASSLYGPEAVGGAVNFITQKPTAITTGKIGVQFDQWGYQRLQASGGGMITPKFGVYVGGMASKQRNSWMTYSNYDKYAVNARADYHISDKTLLFATFAHNDYYSQTAGSVDSIGFYNRQYVSNNTFTYRKVLADRGRITLEHNWNNGSETTLTGFYRYNAIGQNPNYAFKWVTGASTAKGEINEISFRSYGTVLQHSQKFNFLNSRLLVGASLDVSPTKYFSYIIDLNAQLRADKKSVEQYTISTEHPDQFNANFEATLNNSAAYAQFDFNPIKALKISLGGRFDRMAFDFTNFVDNISGTKAYQQFTPKIGATYDFGKGLGLYANYSKGFSPPSLTAIFRKRTTPAANGDLFYYNLEPALFDNTEVGGWASLFGNKLYVDFALYQMNGTNELLNIRQPDNSTDYQSVGKTLHKGIEYSLTYKPTSEWNIRLGGTNALHQFVEFVLSNKTTDALKNVNGYDMPQSPSWVANVEVTYKPKTIKGLRTALEWNRVSSWYQNQINTVKYADKGFLGLEGISTLNLRLGYAWKNIEVYTNVMNLTNELYANNASRGNNATDRTTYTPAAPRTFVMGIQYNFMGK